MDLTTMVNNNEACHVNVRNDGSLTVTLRPAVIAGSLKDKISDDGITTGQQIIERQRKIMDMPRTLYNKCKGMECPLECENFRAVPNGCTHAGIMFVNRQPTMYEACSGFSQCDKASIFFALMLSKLHIRREDIYCTDMLKCHTENVDETSVCKCVTTYLSKEVEYVHPKLIICNGLNVLKVWNKLGFISGLPDNTAYGIIYDVIISGTPVKITAIYELNKVLSKTGDEYKNCKDAVWKQVVTAIQSVSSTQKGK